jgi:taurine dioxygenase
MPDFGRCQDVLGHTPAKHVGVLHSERDGVGNFASLGDGEAVWHADMTYVDVPPKAAVLYALEVPRPESGGNTYFANMFAAFETLPEELKKAAEGMHRLR